MAQFESLFGLLELELTDGQTEQLFAYCDRDCSGFISEREFVKGWSKLVDVFLEKSAGSAGVSSVQIVVTCALLVGALGLLFAFVLTTFAAWNTEDSFIATVQAGLVAACGKLGTLARRRGVAEQGNVDGFVGDIISKQTEDAVEDGAGGGGGGGS